MGDELYGLSEKDVTRLKRLLTAFEEGRLDRLLSPAALRPGGPLWTELAVAPAAIGPLVGAVPGSGSGIIQQIDLSGSGPAVIDGAPSGEWAGIYNIGQTTIPPSAIVPLFRDPSFGQWFTFNTSLPDRIQCWLSAVCPQFTTIQAVIVGSGSGPQSIDVMTGINNETTCTDLLTQIAQVTCTLNPDDCCPTEPGGCCCVCRSPLDTCADAQPICVTLANGTGCLACLNGTSFTVLPNDACCVNLERNALCGQSPAATQLYAGAGPVEVCGGAAQVHGFFLYCPKGGGPGWQNIMMGFAVTVLPPASALCGCDTCTPTIPSEWQCLLSTEPGLDCNGEEITLGDPSFGRVLPTSGNCAVGSWNLTYTAVPIYRWCNGDQYLTSPVQIGTIDIICTCGACGSGSQSGSSGSGPSCGITSVGLGRTQSATSAVTSLTLSGVTLQAGALLVVNAAAIGAGIAPSVAFNGHTMSQDNSEPDVGGANYVATYSYTSATTQTGNIVVTSSVPCCLKMDAVQVSGLVNNAPDQKKAAHGQATRPDTGATGTTSTACEYANAAFYLEWASRFPPPPYTWQAPFQNGHQDSSGGCGHPQPPVYILTEGYAILSGQQTVDASLAVSPAPDNWAGVLTTYS